MPVVRRLLERWTSPPTRREHAVVIGGSLAGLLDAAALSAHFERVTIVERDALPSDAACRKGVPQDRHGHGLLAGGYDAIAALVPEFESDIRAHGAVVGDVIRDVRWFYFGGYKARFESGLGGALMSRPLIESLIRRRVLGRDNVSLRQSRVHGLVGSRWRVRGVRLEDDETLAADLVVDASGRGSKTGEWLEALGASAPEREELKVGIGYSSRVYRRKPEHLGGDLGVILSPTPPDRRVGFMLAIEDDRWIVSIGGWLGDHAPVDDEGYLAFAKTLPRPDIYETIATAEPLSDIASYKFRSNLRRRYEKLERIPSGILVTGDALCSFNPIYAQGMATAALEAVLLRELLRAHEASDAALPRRFFRRAARLLDNPWMLATSHDLRYPEVAGTRSVGLPLLHRYVERVQDAANHDEAVCRAMFDVANLLAPPASLFEPRVLRRVVRARFRR